ncbi:GtrA family protein [Nocardioides marmoraquaticus]
MSPRDRFDRLDPTRLLGSGARLVSRFGTIGALAFVVDVGVFNLLRQLVELGPLTSKTVAVVLATSVAFVGNRSWTFGDRGAGRRLRTAYVLFFAANGVALLISLACLGLSTYVLGLDSVVAENVSSNVVGLGLGTLFRFWAYARWVFPPTTDEPASAAEVRPGPPPREAATVPPWQSTRADVTSSASSRTTPVGPS